MVFEEVWFCNAVPPACPNASVQSKTPAEATSPFNQICFSIRGKSSEAAVKALETFGQLTIDTATAPTSSAANAVQTPYAETTLDGEDEKAMATWMPLMNVPLEIRADLLKIVRAIELAFKKMRSPDAATREQGGKEFAQLLYETKESYLICMAKIREKPMCDRTPEQRMYIKDALNLGAVAEVGLGGPRALQRLMWLASHPQELEHRLRILSIIDLAPARVRSSLHGGRTSADKDVSREHSRGYDLLKALNHEINELTTTGNKGLPPSIIHQMANVLLQQGSNHSGRKADPVIYQTILQDYFPKLLDSDAGLSALFAVSTRLSRNPFEDLSSELKRSSNVDAIRELCDQITAAAADQSTEYLDRNSLKISARTMLRWARELEDRFLQQTGSEFQFKDV